MELQKEKDQLIIDNIQAKVYDNLYTEKLRSAHVGEKIIINPLENVFNEFPTTTRKGKKLFSNGFIKYTH